MLANSGNASSEWIIAFIYISVTDNNTPWAGHQNRRFITRSVKILSPYAPVYIIATIVWWNKDFHNLFDWHRPLVLRKGLGGRTVGILLLAEIGIANTK